MRCCAAVGTLTGCAAFEYFTARVISAGGADLEKLISGVAGFERTPKKGSPRPSAPRESLLRHNGPFNEKGFCNEKESAFAGKFGRHVFERCSARHTVACSYSPLYKLLERDENIILPATHGGQLLLPANPSV